MSVCLHAGMRRLRGMLQMELAARLGKHADRILKASMTLNPAMAVAQDKLFM